MGGPAKVASQQIALLERSSGFGELPEFAAQPLGSHRRKIARVVVEDDMDLIGLLSYLLATLSILRRVLGSASFRPPIGN